MRDRQRASRNAKIDRQSGKNIKKGRRADRAGTEVGGERDSNTEGKGERESKKETGDDAATNRERREREKDLERDS